MPKIPASFEESVTQKLKVMWTTICLIAAAAIIAIGVSTWGWVRLTGDEHASCVIQKAGLPASKHLAKAEADIGWILNYSLKKETKAQRAKIGKTVQDHYDDLAQQSAAYGSLENKEPSTRSC